MISKEKILEKFMECVLETGGYPESVYRFCKRIEIEEKDFYQFYGSLEALEKGVFQAFFDETIVLLEKDEKYSNYSSKEKLLGFYYTFFELLSANRSYVVQALKKHKMSLKNLKQLDHLKKSFVEHLDDLWDESSFDIGEKLDKYKTKIQDGAGWFQFLLILRFWMKDESPSFEKTDVFIEKTVHVSEDLLDTSRLKNLLDWGKFVRSEFITS